MANGLVIAVNLHIAEDSYFAVFLQHFVFGTFSHANSVEFREWIGRSCIVGKFSIAIRFGELMLIYKFSGTT